MNDNDGSELRTLTVANLEEILTYVREEEIYHTEVMISLGSGGLSRLVKVEVDQKNKRLVLVGSTREFEGWRANQ